ncbi:restriction endonuclease subunit S [Neobacillus sp. OS1-2]|uniref:restriction endonuclease subunit S n=1 Tax=Neobacillus sp. OS1-2 TaxID=3070680 RepID=UPI0027E1AEF0|nr:restriction endonuclease subunit S [Neobacillus sp. OS1-2]WML42008.1 restriction endonuclease subunit S [Neobacillus sp. OS1-2]
MNKNKKTALVPKLRFKEYESAKPWKVISLIDTVDKNVKWSFTGGPFGSNLKSSDYKNEGIRVIQLQNIGDGEFVNDYKIFTSKEKADELIGCNIYPYEIIMSKMGDPVGRACIIPNFHSRYLMCSDGIRLVIDERCYSKYFIYSLINSKFFRKKIESHSTGSTRKRIGLEVLKNLQIAVPEKGEQQKIADCLSSLDDLIDAEDKKLEALKAHKKGLMQKLFSAEGKTLPEWRFPEFRDCGEWEENTFKSFIKLYRGSSPRPIQKYFTKNSGVNWIKIGDAKNSDGYKIRSVEEQITHEGAQKSRFVTSGELILANSMSYGKTYEIEISGCIYDGWFVLREYEEHFNKKFLLQQLNSDNLQKQYSSLSAGGVVQNISSDIVYSTILKRPQLEEQQKIAEFLSSIDDLITAQADKIEALQAHKKGLMQGLFPSIQEVGE